MTEPSPSDVDEALNAEVWSTVADLAIPSTRLRPNEDLHDQLDRLHVWVDQVPPQYRGHVAATLDSLAALLGELVATPTEDQP